MEQYTYLLDKLSITDFKLRGEYGESVLDLLMEYSRQVNSEDTGISDIKNQIGSQTGLSINAIKKLLALPDDDLERLISGNDKFVDSIPDDELPEDYRNAKAKIDHAKKILALDKALPSQQRKALEADILEGDKTLLELKQQLIKDKMSNDPNLLAKNPKTVKILLDIIDEDVPEYQADQKQLNIRKIRKSIETDFLTMKGFESSVIEKIVKGTHEMSLAKKEFLDLLKAIADNDELLNQKEVFFTSTPS